MSQHKQIATKNGALADLAECANKIRSLHIHIARNFLSIVHPHVLYHSGFRSYISTVQFICICYNKLSAVIFRCRVLVI